MIIQYRYICKHTIIYQNRFWHRSIMTFYRHYIDVIMTMMASQITSLTVVYSIGYSDADQRKHQSSASLGFVRGIHRDRWISRTKGQLRGKWFHLMTSSWDIMQRTPSIMHAARGLSHWSAVRVPRNIYLSISLGYSVGTGAVTGPTNHYHCGYIFHVNRTKTVNTDKSNNYMNILF